MGLNLNFVEEKKILENFSKTRKGQQFFRVRQTKTCPACHINERSKDIVVFVKKKCRPILAIIQNKVWQAISHSQSVPYIKKRPCGQTDHITTLHKIPLFGSQTHQD